VAGPAGDLLPALAGQPPGFGRMEEVAVKLFTKGNRVTQANYGAGTITSSDERYTVIEFDNHGRRVFITDMVTLGQTDEPAPSKKKGAGKRKKTAVATQG
jgi:hypothetical protein